ncbi:MAG: hypothetical protein LUF32_06885 [Clostridiales bacterium]|nr:hypothetical protein [Clostridiales bacterium]
MTTSFTIKNENPTFTSASTIPVPETLTPTSAIPTQESLVLTPDILTHCIVCLGEMERARNTISQY